MDVDLYQWFCRSRCDTVPQSKHVDPNHNLTYREGIWHIRYKLGGVSKRQTLSTSDVVKARKERDRILKEVLAHREGRIIEAEKTWEDAVLGCLASLDARARAGEISASAVARYTTSIAQITQGLTVVPDGGEPQPIPLSEVTKATVTDFVEDRRENGLSTSTILNDLTAWSRVMAYAASHQWIVENPLRGIERRELVGTRRSDINPPTDAEIGTLIAEISGWSQHMARLLRWLRETGMRLAEALNLRRADIHPCGTKATLRLGVKRNRGADGGPMTRTIDLGRAAALLAEMPEKGRLFAGLHMDSAIVSTRYGQWRRQKQGRENRAAEAEGREPVVLATYRLHDLRHAFAVASLVDDPKSIYRLSEHMGHTLVSTTEIYTGHLRRDGAMWRYSRDKSLFGSLPAEVAEAA
jgi:integrase